MKSLKFASLILLCATSVLALILPALGVVSFPEKFISADVNNRTSVLGEAENPINAPLTHLARNAENALQELGASISENLNSSSASSRLTSDLAGPTDGVPARTASFGNASTSLNQPSGQVPYGGQPPYNTQTQYGAPLQLPTSSPVAEVPAGPPTELSWNQDPSTRKVGTGIWLLLGPVWLFALLVWSVAPAPSGTNALPTKRRK